MIAAPNHYFVYTSQEKKSKHKYGKFMKNNYITLLCAFFMPLMIVCCTGDRHYVVHKEDVLSTGFKQWREYFVSVDNDTMAASFSFKRWSGDRLQLSVDFNQDIKHFQQGSKKSGGKYKVSTYQEFLQQFGECLKEARNDIDISRVGSMEILLLDNLPDIAIAVSRQLTKENLFNHSAVDSALYRTSLKSDLEGILQRYHLCVGEMMSVDMIIPVDAEDYAKQYNLSRDSLPEKIIGVLIYVGLESMDVK